MTDLQKQEFTLRITSANKTEMIVILCDMFTAYIDEANADMENKDTEAFKASVRKARAVIGELLNSLDMSYELARDIYALYRYVDRLLIKAEIKLDKIPLVQARNIILKLNASYEELSKLDTSAPVMGNAETVYAGMTYGKADINENMSGSYNRGFLA